MDVDENKTICKLYRLDPDLSLHVMDEDIIVSNGPCFSPDDRTFYFADSRSRRISAYDYDIKTGALSNKRTFAELTSGAPDGGTVDAGRLHMDHSRHCRRVASRSPPDMRDSWEEKCQLATPAYRIKQAVYRAENAGGIMADGYARIANRVSVVTAQNGPAATLLVPPLAEALKASTPIVALVQEVPTAQAGKNPFQEFDRFRLFDAVAKLGEQNRSAGARGRIRGYGFHRCGLRPAGPGRPISACRRAQFAG